ncbi:MAG: agmatine/peptidylarginine deiminase [Paracoccaceae bacterium]
MPAEWARHTRTWMMWPCRTEVWDSLGRTRQNYADVAHAIRRFEPVTMVVHPRDRAGARDLLGTDIDLMEHPIDDSWARDAGPCFLTDGQGRRATACFEFNAWGQKYHPYDGDNSVAETVADLTGLRAYTSTLVAEGGGVSVDGEGTVLTTETCFPNANRNPGWTRDAIEAELKAMLGADKVIWLPGNVLETETDGHVDGIAVFASPGEVIVQSDMSSDHPWHNIHRANIAALEDQTDAKGRPLHLTRVPAASISTPEHANFCDSFVNFYICNDAVIMPNYGLQEDEIVRDLLQDRFPKREIVGVDITEIAIGGGGIHCITQQEPA